MRLAKRTRIVCGTVLMIATLVLVIRHILKPYRLSDSELQVVAKAVDLPLPTSLHTAQVWAIQYTEGTNLFVKISFDQRELNSFLRTQRFVSERGPLPDSWQITEIGPPWFDAIFRPRWFDAMPFLSTDQFVSNGSRRLLIRTNGSVARAYTVIPDAIVTPAINKVLSKGQRPALILGPVAMCEAYWAN